MGLEQLLHFPQALVKDGLVQLSVGHYLRNTIEGGGGVIIQKGTVIHAYSWQGNLVCNRIQQLVGHHVEELGLRFSKRNPVGFATPIYGKTYDAEGLAF